MRILHVVHQYPPDHIGGTELYTWSLARRQAEAGHSVAVFCPEYSATSGSQPSLEDGVRVYRAGGGRRGRTAVFLSTLGEGRLAGAFAAVLAAERPEVVHLQHLMGLPAALVGAINEANIPYIITLHDYWYVCANAQLVTNDSGMICGGPDARYVNCGRCALARAGAGALTGLAPVVAPLMARRARSLWAVFTGAAAVLASTDFVRRTFAAAGLPADHVRVLPLGVEISAPEIEAARRARRDGAGGPLRLGYIGGLSAQKGVHILIEAVNRLPAEGVSLSLYGDPQAFPEYSAGLRRLATHPGIHFEGLLSRRELWPVLGGLDALVAPTLWYETYSIITHEAFAAGTPVVASRIGVMPEVIREGVDGLLFAPGDVAALRDILLHLMEHPERVAALRGGIRPVPTATHHSRDVLDLYQAILSGWAAPEGD